MFLGGYNMGFKKEETEFLKKAEIIVRRLSEISGSFKEMSELLQQDKAQKTEQLLKNNQENFSLIKREMADLRLKLEMILDEYGKNR